MRTVRLIALAALVAGFVGCTRGRSYGTPEHATDHWRTNIESELYSRARRDLGCPVEALDCACVDDRCNTVNITGCSRIVTYTYDRSRTWVLVPSTAW